VSYLVRYDGTGLRTDGKYCEYQPDTVICITDAVIYDGVGLKPFYEEVQVYSTCSGGTFVVYDGTGLTTWSTVGDVCVPIL